MYTKLDVIRCSDIFIHHALGNSAFTKMCIPEKYRRSSTKVKEYYRLGKEARSLMQRRDDDYLFRFDAVLSKNK